jgi:hypothetical protein
LVWETLLRAGAFRFLGAVADAKSAMLYSLNAMTTYGHESVSLEQHWQMMGALEALNGMLLFGLTTAFLFAMIQERNPVKNLILFSYLPTQSASTNLP